MRDGLELSRVQGFDVTGGVKLTHEEREVVGSPLWRGLVDVTGRAGRRMLTAIGSHAVPHASACATFDGRTIL